MKTLAKIQLHSEAIQDKEDKEIIGPVSTKDEAYSTIHSWYVFWDETLEIQYGVKVSEEGWPFIRISVNILF